ncbi:putative C2 domain-containing protein [Helianthus annuus]|nr:putative C2 domain-containing protein [Helianthus annuus]
METEQLDFGARDYKCEGVVAYEDTRLPWVNGCVLFCVAKHGNKLVRTRMIIDSFSPTWNEQYTWEVLIRVRE